MRQTVWILATALTLATVGVACAPGNAPGAPPRPELSGIDSEGARAIEGLLAEVASAPRDAGLRARLGMAYEVNGLVGAAERCYEDARGLDPTEARWPHHLAWVRALRGDLDGALEANARVLELAPDYLPARILRGEWLLDAGEVAQAAAIFTEVLEREDGVAGRSGLARCRLREGRAADARDLLEPIADDRAAAQVYQLLGLAYRELGQLDRARAALARGTPGGNRRTAFPDPWLADKAAFDRGYLARVRRAERLLGGGKFDEAIALLEDVRRRRPDDLAVYRGLATAHLATDATDRAIEILNAGIGDHPQSIDLYLLQSRAYVAAGERERALAVVDKAIEINPAFGKAHAQRGGLLLGLRRFDEALVSFDRALDLGELTPRNLMTAGTLESRRGRWPEAARRFEQAVRAAPELAAAYVGLGGARAELGRLDAAAEALERAAALGADERQLAAARGRLAELSGGGS